ncbi:unnamed protein product [Thlaspi arvense]|uniref:TSL-kinase interacting protein 1 n=1 Tax=Thlaspi arvense TaxID=13288 RepID=A0AAU9SZ10_THLAR|nr:unnamed protein product [Thlaspi arvense]
MARKRTKTATEPPKEIKTRGKFTRANKCMKTTTKRFHESGKHKSKREEKAASKCSDESPPSSQVQRPINTKDGAQEVGLSGKMKLQLFPLDSRTREGLEKDGFHPYLELTLSSRKKVSSVLQHIHAKWGSSEIARGDPTLYPYDKPVLASGGHKWTANSKITTNDVYVAIGAPSLFRLRYGWSSEACDKTDEPPSPPTPRITCFPNEEPQNVITNKTEMFGLDNLSSENAPPDGPVESAEKKTNDGSGPTFFSWDDDGLTSLSIGGLLSEVSLKGSCGNHSKNPNSGGNANATLWEDNLTNISIGGLFSEASLQHRCGINREQESTHCNNNDQPNGGLLSQASSLGEGRKTWETRKAVSQQQPLPLISDSSLDAFFVSQTEQPRAPPELSHSSILDAEDTCHAFSFRKRTTTSQKVLEQVKLLPCCFISQYAFLIGLEFATREFEFWQVSEEAEERNESKPAKGLFGSTAFNQDSSLGFSGFKWADSRGPFDFGLSSSSRKFPNGDSVSFGAVVKDLQEMEPLQENVLLPKH